MTDFSDEALFVTINRQAAEIERLQTGWELATKAVDENQSLKIDNERLRAALSDMLKHFKQYEDAECCKRVYAQARRALETKP